MQPHVRNSRVRKFQAGLVSFRRALLAVMLIALALLWSSPAAAQKTFPRPANGSQYVPPDRGAKEQIVLASRALPPGKGIILHV